MVIIERVPYKSIVVETEIRKEIISVGEKIKFIVEDTSEVKRGTVTGFKGTKPEKVEIEIIPEGCKHRETWHILEMLEGSLKLIVDGDGEDEVDED